MKLDPLDEKIISLLQKDARRTFSDIARELGVKTGKVQTRFQRMQKAGLIIGSTLFLDMAKMGTVYEASIGLQVLDSKIDEVLNYVNGLKIEKAKIFAWPVFGRYNVASYMIFGNIVQSHRIKQTLRQHPAVIDVAISLTKDFEGLKFYPEPGESSKWTK